MRPTKRYLRELGAIALFRMGYTDFALLAELLDTTVAEIARIERADAPTLRAWAVSGTPHGESTELTAPIRCPECGRRLIRVPCLVCERDRFAPVRPGPVSARLISRTRARPMPWRRCVRQSA